MKRKPIQAIFCVALGLLISGMVGFLLGRGDLITARQVMSTLKAESYYGVPADELDQGAVRGMLNALPDPMAVYLTPQNMEAFQKYLEGESTVGLGIESVRVSDGYYVSAVMENSPAQIGGIAKGDVVVAINGRLVRSGAVWPSLASGEKVELVVSRNGTERTQNVFAAEVAPFSDVEREMIGTVGYIRLRSFTQPGMETQTVDALREYLKKGDVILDLRHNSGGRLNAALTIAEAFVPKGQPLLFLNEAQNKREIYRSQDGSLSQYKIYILVDSQSASASEVLAGILQEYGKAVLIGSKTYGKGTVQKVTQLQNGGGIRFTVAEYVLPDGTQIDGNGLLADFAVPDAEIPGWVYTHERDDMLQFALQTIRQ